MFLRLTDDSELMLCKAPGRSYTALPAPSKANFSLDRSPTISAREASAASAARFKRQSRKLAFDTGDVSDRLGDGTRKQPGGRYMPQDPEGRFIAVKY
jgi:hypothetical protein